MISAMSEIQTSQFEELKLLCDTPVPTSVSRREAYDLYVARLGSQGDAIGMSNEEKELVLALIREFGTGDEDAQTLLHVIESSS